MPVAIEVPTGREVRAHIELWEALPEGQRPHYPIEKWFQYDQRWEGRYPEEVNVAIHRIPDDDTPQPGLRLVPLPQPETEAGVGWREPVSEAEALAAGTGGAGVLELTTELRTYWSPGAVGDSWDDPYVTYRLPASWAPGRERVEVGPEVKGRTLDGVPVVGFYPMTTALRVQLDDVGGTTVDATVIDGIPYVWVDPIEDEVPGTGEDLCMDVGPRIGGEGTRCYRPKGHDDYHQAHSSWMTVGGLLPTWCDAGIHDTSPYPDLVGDPDGVASEGENSGSPSTDEDPSHEGYHGSGMNLFIGRVSGCPACEANQKTAAEASADAFMERVKSATPATDSVPTSAVASSERASEVVGGGGGAGATTPTRPDPPEGWVVSTDREAVEAADAQVRCQLFDAVGAEYWSEPCAPSVTDLWLADGRYAVPVDMVAEHVCGLYVGGECAECGEPTADPGESWTPQVGDRVLVEAEVAGQAYDNGDIKVEFATANGSTLPVVASSSLRPFPEDGEA